MSAPPGSPSQHTRKCGLAGKGRGRGLGRGRGRGLGQEDREISKGSCSSKDSPTAGRRPAQKLYVPGAFRQCRNDGGSPSTKTSCAVQSPSRQKVENPPEVPQQGSARDSLTHKNDVEEKGYSNNAGQKTNREINERKLVEQSFGTKISTDSDLVSTAKSGTRDHVVHRDASNALDCAVIPSNTIDKSRFVVVPTHNDLNSHALSRDNMTSTTGPVVSTVSISGADSTNTSDMDNHSVSRTTEKDQAAGSMDGSTSNYAVVCTNDTAVTRSHVPSTDNSGTNFSGIVPTNNGNSNTPDSVPADKSSCIDNVLCPDNRVSMEHFVHAHTTSYACEPNALWTPDTRGATDYLSHPDSGYPTYHKTVYPDTCSKTGSGVGGGHTDDGRTTYHNIACAKNNTSVEHNIVNPGNDVNHALLEDSCSKVNIDIGHKNDISGMSNGNFVATSNKTDCLDDGNRDNSGTSCHNVVPLVFTGIGSSSNHAVNDQTKLSLHHAVNEVTSDKGNCDSSTHTDNNGGMGQPNLITDNKVYAIHSVSREIIDGTVHHSGGHTGNPNTNVDGTGNSYVDCDGALASDFGATVNTHGHVNNSINGDQGNLKTMDSNMRLRNTVDAISSLKTTLQQSTKERIIVEGKDDETKEELVEREALSETERDDIVALSFEASIKLRIDVDEGTSTSCVSSSETNPRVLESEEPELEETGKPNLLGEENEAQSGGFPGKAVAACLNVLPTDGFQNEIADSEESGSVKESVETKQKSKRQCKKEEKAKKKVGKLKKKAKANARCEKTEPKKDPADDNKSKAEIKSDQMERKGVKKKEGMAADNSDEKNMEEKKEKEEEDWETSWGEDGECLNSDVLAELNEILDVKDVEIEKPQFDYLSFKPKDVILESGVYDHVVELYDFSPELKTPDLIHALSRFKPHFDIKWVDDTHALAVFSNHRLAQSAIDECSSPMMKLRSLYEGTQESKRKAKRNVDLLQPYKERPQTSKLIANRLVSGALGVRSKMTREERQLEREKIKAEREKKLNKEKQKRDLWESDDLEK